MKFGMLQLVDLVIDDGGFEKVVVGRICRKIPPAFYCVQFEFGCLRVVEGDLQASGADDGPLCNADCNGGC